MRCRAVADVGPEGRSLYARRRARSARGIFEAARSDGRKAQGGF